MASVTAAELRQSLTLAFRDLYTVITDSQVTKAGKPADRGCFRAPNLDMDSKLKPPPGLQCSLDLDNCLGLASADLLNLGCFFQVSESPVADFSIKNKNKILHLSLAKELF